MNFKIKNKGSLHNKEFDMERLRNLGFSFELYDHDTYYGDRYLILGEGNVELNSIEDLVSFVEKFGQIIILDKNTIEIYNDYRE